MDGSESLGGTGRPGMHCLRMRVNDQTDQSHSYMKSKVKAHRLEKKDFPRTAPISLHN